MKKLPKMLRGAEVVRGLGMKSEQLDVLVEKKALNNFDATCEMWLVVEDNVLEDPDSSVQVKGFRIKADAVRYARACANGNVDQRVLRVNAQTLVIATMNEL